MDCHAQVNKFKGTAYRGFNTLEEVEAAWSKQTLDDTIKSSSSSSTGNPIIAVLCIYVKINHVINYKP